MTKKYKLNNKECLAIIKKIRNEIKKYFQKNGLTYAVFGKSMGLDSSVIAGLLSDLSGISPIGVIMPIESDLKDEKIAKIVLKHFKIPAIKIDLTEEYKRLAKVFYQNNSISDQLTKNLSHKDINLIKKMEERKRFALGNIKVRLRMITLYHITQITKGIVISTDNYSEFWMGFWTLHGDVGDFSPIQQVFKGVELYDIAKALGVPKQSIEAKPTDGLNIIPGGFDEDQLGLPYDKLDPVILELYKIDYDNKYNFIKNKKDLFVKISKKLKLSYQKVEQVAKQMESTNYKRRVPIEISRKDIGLLPLELIKL